MYKDKEMIELLRCFCNKLGRKPTDKEICNKNGLPAVTTYILRFGSVYNTFKIVKPEYAIKKQEYLSNYSKKEMLKSLNIFCNELNRRPTTTEINNNKTLPSAATYSSKFGGVTKALNIIRPDLIDRKDYISEYLSGLKRLCDKLNRKPVKWEIDKCDYTPSVTVYRKWFGSLKNVYLIIYPKYAEEIGKNTYKNKKWLKEQHYKKGKTIGEIAKYIHVRRVTISKFMKLHKLEIICVESTRQKHRESTIKSLKNRKVKNTKIEILFENCLKKNNINYEKQWTYKLGVADFYLPKYNAVVECDGDYWHNYPFGKPNDKIHNEYLISIGYKVFRFWEREINKNVEICLLKIIR